MRRPNIRLSRLLIAEERPGFTWILTTRIERRWLDQSSYKEDCEWAIVALTFPDLFTGYERKCADRALRDWWPSEWENIHGRKLEPGESHLKDQQAFKRNHADHWVVISALRSEHHPGMTEVIATRGGRRDLHVEEQRFLVPSAEYQVGLLGFVIDETRHTAYDGPSSFATWQGRQAS